MAEVPVQPQPTKQGIDWKNILIGAIIGVVLVGIIGGLVFYLYQSNSEETTPTQTTTTKTSTPSSQPTTEKTTKEVKPKVSTKGWSTYSNPKEGFKYEFKYPNNWKIHLDPKDYGEVSPQEEGYISQTTLQLISSNWKLEIPGPGYLESGTLVYIKKPVDKPTGKSLLEYAEETTPNLTFQEISIGGNEGVYGEEAKIVNEKKTTSYEYLVLSGQRIVSIGGGYLTDNKDGFGNIIETISSTFEFLE
jgi:hypothetical protein